MLQLAQGVSGRLFASYQLAAELGHWKILIYNDRLLSEPIEWLCEAELLYSDEFWLGTYMAKYNLHLDVGKQVWVWSDIAVKEMQDDGLRVVGHGRPKIIR